MIDKEIGSLAGMYIAEAFWSRMLIISIKSLGNGSRGSSPSLHGDIPVCRMRMVAIFI